MFIGYMIYFIVQMFIFLTAPRGYTHLLTQTIQFSERNSSSCVNLGYKLLPNQISSMQIHSSRFMIWHDWVTKTKCTNFQIYNIKVGLFRKPMNHFPVEYKTSIVRRQLMDGSPTPQPIADNAIRTQSPMKLSGFLLEVIRWYRFCSS